MPAIGDYLTQLDHVGIAVADLTAAVEFYQNTLGMIEIHREENQEQQVAEVMLQPKAGGALIQLLAPLSPTSAIAKFIEKRGVGMQQLAFSVTDVEEVAAAARAANIRVLYDSAKRGTNNSKINFLHPADCGGVLIELVQHA
jgi:methylmalonyl-CoA/ethylmalonyl-CoA epimerase